MYYPEKPLILSERCACLIRDGSSKESQPDRQNQQAAKSPVLLIHTYNSDEAITKSLKIGKAILNSKSRRSNGN